MIKHLLPRSLLGRSLLIIVTPLVLMQVVSGFIFYESHWDKVAYRLARGVAGDVATITTLLRRFPSPEDREWIFETATKHMAFSVSFKNKEILPNLGPAGSGITEKMLIRALRDHIGNPFRIDAESLDRHVLIDVQLSEGVLQVITPRKRLFSSTTYVFVLWMVGTSLLLLGIAAIFMRNQVKSVRRLAIAADNLGKGRDVTRFKPEGAKEVRQAATAFLAMRERILRHISQRTEMLAGVSHDLRTPLTRMKLQLEMTKGAEEVAEIKNDVAEMEHMLESYLAFARGEGGEKPAETNVSEMLGEVASQARRKGCTVDLHTEGEILASLKPNAVRRCLNNLIENALRYADHVSLRAGYRDGAIEIVIDDDGPGIPADKRDDVFKPFFRVESSRNPETGGSGLGLAIARDIARGHGGDIFLEDSPSGGLRARLTLPL